MPSSAAAARAEALKSHAPRVITWRDKEYHVIPTADWDITVLEAMEDGAVTHILRGILADNDYAQLVAERPKITDLEEFVKLTFSALGVAGN